MRERPPKPKRKRPVPREENRPSSKPKTETDAADSDGVVKTYHGTDAQAAAARIGVLHSLPDAIRKLTMGGAGRTGCLEPVTGGWILAILGTDIGWLSFESPSRDALEEIESKYLPGGRSVWIDGGEKWN